MKAEEISTDDSIQRTDVTSKSFERKYVKPYEETKSQKNILSKYYKSQNELLENYEKDSKIIRVFKHEQLNRKRKQNESESSGTKLKRRRSENMYEESDMTSSKMSLLENHEKNVQDAKDSSKAAARLAHITLFVNFSLMIAKVTASWLSGSMSIISSMVDSVVDITSGLVLSISSRLIRKSDPYLYPRGRTRLEPLSLILISIIMGMASVQLIFQSVRRIHEAYQFYELGIGSEPDLDVTWVTVTIMLSTVVIKFTLFLICQKYPDNSSVQVLAMDHRNDCLSNTTALVCAWLAKNYWFYFDSIGAIIVSLYILSTWVRTGGEQIGMLIGKTASPEFINRIINVCIEHDEKITHVDTVYVYHYGTKFLVEVHIVLDELMPLKQAHDIAEGLQTSIESLPEVERSFVHMDYNFNHHPHDEHKIV